MAGFELHLPSQGIIFGAGRLVETGSLAKRFGSRCLLVVGTGRGVPAKLAESLKAAGISYEVFEKVIPNPTFESIDEAAAIAKGNKSQFIIGLGGGSAMDTAKGVAVAATHEGSIWPYAIGEKQISSNVLPVVAISTTSGTGSQCTQFSVISNNKTKQKPGMGSGHILPSLAIVDPELMLTVPKAGTLFTGFDVFAHGVEAYTSKLASPFSDMFAEKAITLATQWLPKAYADGSNLEARAGMALADTYAGIAINHGCVSLGHVMAHVLGGHFPKMAHGDALLSIYREVLAFNSSALKDRHAFIANALCKGCKDPVKAYEKFISQFDLKGSLASQSSHEQLKAVAVDVFTYMKGVTELNPVDAVEKDVLKILEKSVAA